MSIFTDVKDLAGGANQSKQWYREQLQYGLEDYTGAINDLNRGLELEPSINPICEDLYFKEAFRKIKIDN